MFRHYQWLDIMQSYFENCLGNEELVRPSGNTKFLDALAESVEKDRPLLTALEKYAYLPEGERMSSVIKQYTGLRIVFRKSSPLGVHIPSLSVNTAIMGDRSGENVGKLVRESMRNVAKNVKGVALAGIDYKTGKVSGAIASYPIAIDFDESLYDKFTYMELAAMLLHEVGHVIVSITLAANVVKTEFIVEEAVKRLTGKRKDEDTFIPVTELNAYLEAPSKDGTVSDKDVRAILISEEKRKLHSELGTDIYSIRGFEQLADEYATAMGGGKHLVSGLIKIQKIKGNNFRANRAARFFRTVLADVGGLVGMGLLVSESINGDSLLAEKGGKTINGIPLQGLLRYDTFSDRVKLIKQNLIGQLSEFKKGSEEYEETLNSITTIVKAVDSLPREELDDLFRFWLLSSAGRRFKEENKKNKTMKDLVFNDLLYASAILNKTLGV